MQTDKIDVIYAPLHISRQDWALLRWPLWSAAFCCMRSVILALCITTWKPIRSGRSTCSIHWKRTYGVYFASLIVRGLKSIADVGYDAYPHGLDNGACGKLGVLSIVSDAGALHSRSVRRTIFVWLLCHNEHRFLCDAAIVLPVSASVRTGGGCRPFWCADAGFLTLYGLFH